MQEFACCTQRDMNIASSACMLCAYQAMTPQSTLHVTFQFLGKNKYQNKGISMKRQIY